MASAKSAVSIGLEGVPVAETVLSLVDGSAGRLIVAGHDVEDLAGHERFEQVAARLWGGDGPPLDAGVVGRAIGASRAAALAKLSDLGGALDAPDAMDALRAAVAHLSEAEGADEPRWAAAARLTGAVSVFATAWARRRFGVPAVAPDPTASHAADFLRLLRGAPAPAHEVAALDAYFVTVIDHGLNASTFAARVVASTGSDLVSAVTAAIGALKGPLHGGAPGPVLDMLDAVGEASHAREWLGSELDARRRIMGMGHRVYRVRDPRAAVLEAAIDRLRRVISEGGGGGEAIMHRLELARAVEREATALLAARHPDRALRANVEFYTAVLLEAVGVPRALFSATFASARVVGWTAHVDEERRKGRLIRPSSVYKGKVPKRNGDLATGLGS
jgi:citrate synthase